MLRRMDEHDLEILRVLQQDNGTTIEAIAERIGLSAAAVQRRIKKLRASKVIEKDVSVVAQEKVGLPLTIVISVVLERERLDLIEEFKRDIRKAPQVQQCYSVTGTTDFVLVVIAKDMAQFEAFTRRVFFNNPNVRRFETSIVTERVKAGLALPI